MADKLGTLEAGKLADLIVVDGKPDQDLKALERVEMTFIGGKRMYG
jgi:imidazolonepropionase-like amidohydrolase